jgi:glycosyltransferase involved in cell wall biosynthesis
MAEKCWPSIKAANPEARLVIAGSTPARSVLELAKISGVQVTGAVPTMAAIIQTAQIAVAPMQSGSGMQLKILEAMACGVPVVTTSIGLGDIKAQPQKQIIVKNTPEEFICSIINLLRSANLRNHIGVSGRHFVFENHSSVKICSNFEDIINFILK